MEGAPDTNGTPKRSLIGRFLRNINGPNNDVEPEINLTPEKRLAQSAIVATSLLSSTPANALDVSRTAPQTIDEAIDAAAASDRAIKCLTENVYHEARGENVEGKLAVALITLGRTLSLGTERFPTDVCGVVYQKKQFSWTADENLLKRPIDAKRFETIRTLLMEKLKGRKISEAVTILSMTLGMPVETLYYKRTDWTLESGRLSKGSHEFFSSLKEVRTIGNHTFYRAKKKNER